MKKDISSLALILILFFFSACGGGSSGDSGGGGNLKGRYSGSGEYLDIEGGTFSGKLQFKPGKCGDRESLKVTGTLSGNKVTSLKVGVTKIAENDYGFTIVNGKISGSIGHFAGFFCAADINLATGTVYREAGVVFQFSLSTFDLTKE